MADEVDIANDLVEHRLEVAIANARARPLVPGNSGDCDMCGEWAGRLVVGVCAPCRDKWRLE